MQEKKLLQNFRFTINCGIPFHTTLRLKLQLTGTNLPFYGIILNVLPHSPSSYQII